MLCTTATWHFWGVHSCGVQHSLHRIASTCAHHTNTGQTGSKACCAAKKYGERPAGAAPQGLMLPQAGPKSQPAVQQVCEEAGHALSESVAGCA